MKNSIPESLLSQLSEFVADRMALHFPREGWNNLERKANSAAKEFGFTDGETFIQWLISSPLTTPQMEILASHLTIAETYFWREPQVFEALEEKILPELIRSKENGSRQLRIWSAGCATGEEPYSIAIALHRVIPNLKNWHITIMAMDINPRILRKATAGVYSEWSFRNAPPWLKEGYFCRKEDRKYEIVPEIRKMVTFAYLNLAEDIFPSPLNNTNAMDIIFCRNVLMYFLPGRAMQIGQRLYHSLVDGGWLMVGASELSQYLFSQFTSVRFSGAMVYRKETRESQPSVVFHREEIPPQRVEFQTPVEYTAEVERAGLSSKLYTRETMEKVENPALQQTEYAEALNFYKQGCYAETIEKHDETPPALALSVRELANQGKLVEALALCETSMVADKLDPGLHYLHALILQEQDRETEAIASLKRALYLDPNLALAHFALGNLVLRQGNARKAKKYFENVLELLNVCCQEDILPESEGLTAGRFREIIRATIQAGAST